MVRQNVLLSLLVKSVFIALAAAGMASLWGAIAADMGASLLVIFNGLRLLRVKCAEGDANYPALCRSEFACRTSPKL